ncbi:hypothetical protein OG394_18840 [Kribbella sp. NBC_01245]|uniref:hypothetical protein n=1 Tax=Kribbella sp. NBC_01245 TaxID=2903578 RepID=UPI002E2C7F24|nr:hypothetical protein [Kribbella sp. NBC_01245]
MQSVVRRALATAAAAAVVAVAGGQSSASASTEFAPDYFRICVDQACTMSVSGDITWGNRTARVAGDVVNKVPGAITMVHWDAFAGSTKVDSATSYVPYPNQAVVAPYDFNLGDPLLPGGIDRIRIQICSSPTRCSVQWNEIRD